MLCSRALEMARLIVVEDNAELASLIASSARSRGHLAREAYTGQSALAALVTQPFDVAVVDLLLPDMRGGEILAELKTRNIPAVVMSGVYKGDRFEKDAQRLYGVRAYFEKPFDLRALLDKLEEILGISHEELEELEVIEPLEEVEDPDDDEPLGALEPLPESPRPPEHPGWTSTLEADEPTAKNPTLPPTAPAAPPPPPAPAPDRMMALTSAILQEETKAASALRAKEQTDERDDFGDPFTGAPDETSVTVEREMPPALKQLQTARPPRPITPPPAKPATPLPRQVPKPPEPPLTEESFDDLFDDEATATDPNPVLSAEASAKRTTSTEITAVASPPRSERGLDRAALAAEEAALRSDAGEVGRELGPPGDEEVTPFGERKRAWEELPRPTGRPAGASTSITSGELRSSSVPRLLNAYYQARHQGELRLRQGQVQKVVFFEAGKPIYAASNLAQERFARFCARKGLLPESSLPSVAALSKEKGLRTGDAMIQLMLITSEQRRALLEEQVKEIIWSTFTWKDGEYSFTSKQPRWPDLVKLSVFPGDLIMEGAAKGETLLSLRSKMNAARRLFPSADPPYGLHEIKLSDQQAFLLAHADGTKTVEDLLTLTDLSERDALATLHGLELLGLLEERRDDGKQRRISFGF